MSWIENIEKQPKHHLPTTNLPTTNLPTSLRGDVDPRATIRNARFSTFRRLAALRSVLCVLSVLTLIVAGCNGGIRPTLVADPPPTPQPALQLDLTPAPAGTVPLPPASADLALEASVDDALLAWAADQNVPYLDACQLVTPAAGQLCDTPTERDTVRLLGPTAAEPWYVVVIEAANSLDFGTGYRVSSVTVAGN